MSKEYDINNWKEFFFRVIYCLIEIDKDKFEAFVFDPNMQGRDMENISLSPSKMRLPVLIKNTKIFVETNVSANGFRNRVIDMLNKFCIDLSEVEIDGIIK